MDGACSMHGRDETTQMIIFYRCSVQSEIYTVHTPTNALFIKLGKV